MLPTQLLSPKPYTLSTVGFRAFGVSRMLLLRGFHVMGEGIILESVSHREPQHVEQPCGSIRENRNYSNPYHKDPYHICFRSSRVSFKTIPL